MKRRPKRRRSSVRRQKSKNRRLNKYRQARGGIRL